MKRLIAATAAVALLCGLNGGAWAGVVDGITGLELWLDAGNITGLVDGDQVDLWPAGPGTTRDATRSTASSDGFPHYVVNPPGVINGQPSVAFSMGGTDWFDFFDVENTRTVFCYAWIRVAVKSFGKRTRIFTALLLL